MDFLHINLRHDCLSIYQPLCSFIMHSRCFYAKAESILGVWFIVLPGYI